MNKKTWSASIGDQVCWSALLSYMLRALFVPSVRR